ncbi:MAG: twin-arginine translocase TatA/TatE family subunit [Acidobacteria bacterium]|jgi:sec-independent protein translocase protein TatA|nr:twin-arginine translocase TatA/TatE family subunit [Acidobacteriota bacterium]
MSETFILGFIPQGTEWIVVLLVILLLFGGSKLPQLAKALGQSKRAFREGQDEAEEEAQREKLRQVEAAPASRASLNAIDDVALFEEARRRAAMQPSTDKK